MVVQPFDMPRAKGWTEAMFLSAFGKSIIAKEGFFYKMKDLPHFKGSRTRFDAKKPFDAFMVIHGVPVAIEAKTWKKENAFSFSRSLEEHQIEGLDAFQKADGLSFVMLNLYRKRIVGDPGKNCYAFFYWPEIRDRLDESIMKKELLELPVYHGSLTHGYDVEDFLAKISTLG